MDEERADGDLKMTFSRAGCIRSLKEDPGGRMRGCCSTKYCSLYPVIPCNTLQALPYLAIPSNTLHCRVLNSLMNINSVLGHSSDSKDESPPANMHGHNWLLHFSKTW